MKFRPCIDIHNGKVKQIVGGSIADKGDYDITFDSETNFCNVTEVMVEPILEKGTITVKVFIDGVRKAQKTLNLNGSSTVLNID